MKEQTKPMKNRNIVTMLATGLLACFGFLPQTNAAPEVAPPPDGCYPNFTTAEGCQALQFLTSGAANTGVGFRSLYATAAGNFNTGVGAGALVLNTDNDNTAVGAVALLVNTSGSDNTAVGTAALEFNDAGSQNVGVGGFALNNTTSDSNTALGFEALEFNTAHFTNVGVGVFAAQNSDANFNTAVGGFSLSTNTGGGENTAVGAGAIESGDGGNDNTAVGFLAGNDISGNSNTCLGHSTGSTLQGGEANIYIGAEVQPGGTGEFEFIRIGNDTAFTFPYDTYIAGIYGRPVGPAPLAVMCGSDGKLTANVSSRRFKHDIKPMVNASEAILALKPVSFRYNNDSTNAPWFGLIAEDVAQVNPDLIVRDKEGKPFSVRYDAVNAMLLNEFIKEHKKVEEQQASISQLKSEMQTMVTQLKEQAAQIQKVSAQLEVNKSAPQVVVNKP